MKIQSIHTAADYKSHIFSLKVDARKCTVSVPPLRFRKWIQHLHVQVLAFWSMADPLMPSGIPGLEWLITLKPGSRYSTESLSDGAVQLLNHWQAGFALLKTLELEITFTMGSTMMHQVPGRERRSVSECVHGLLQMLDACDTELRARKVMVSAAVEGCRREDFPGEYYTMWGPEMAKQFGKPECGCEGMVEDTLKALFT